MANPPSLSWIISPKPDRPEVYSINGHKIGFLDIQEGVRSFSIYHENTLIGRHGNFEQDFSIPDNFLGTEVFFLVLNWFLLLFSALRKSY